MNGLPIPLYEYVGGPYDGELISLPGAPHRWVIEFDGATVRHYTPREIPPAMTQGLGRYVARESDHGEVYFQWQPAL